MLESCRRHAREDRDHRHLLHTRAAHHLRRIWRDGGAAARGLVAAGIRPGERSASFCRTAGSSAVAYHAATLAGAVPTTLNPTYREREVRYQLENSDAVALVSDGTLLDRNRSERIAGVAPGVHGARARARADRCPSIRSSSSPLSVHLARARARLATDAGDASLLQRHHRAAQGRDAVAPQPGRQRLPDADARRVRRHLRRRCDAVLPAAVSHLRPDGGIESVADVAAARWC